MIVTIVLLVVIYSVAVYTLTRAREFERENLWETYSRDPVDGVGKVLQPVARIFYETKSAAGMASGGRFSESLRKDLEFTGLFIGSLEVYLSVQAAALVIGATLAALSYAPIFSGLASLVLLLVGGAVMLWPWDKVRRTAKEKRQNVLRELPEFADILLMYMESLSVVQACRQTVGKVSGVVSLEMRELVTALTTRTMSENEAFERCAARLGTLEGREFVSALRAAVIEGATASRNMKSQVETLRELRYQQQRSAAKKLPTTLVVSFALHFLPLIFILAGIPVIAALSGLN